MDFVAVLPTETNSSNTKEISLETIKKQLLSIFELLDLQGNGDLDFPEFVVGLKTIGLNDISHEESVKLFASIDSENNGYIDHVSFSEWLNDEMNSSQIEMIGKQMNEQALLLDEDPNEEFLVEMEMQEFIMNSNLNSNDESSDAITKNIDNEIKSLQTIINDKDGNNDKREVENEESKNERNVRRRKKSKRRRRKKKNKKRRKRKSDYSESTSSASSLHSNEQKQKVSISSSIDVESDEKQFVLQDKNTSNSHRNLGSYGLDETVGGMSNANMMPEFLAMQQAYEESEEKEKRKLHRQVSGMGVFRSEDENKWHVTDIDDEMIAMRKQFRRLSQTSMDFTQVQDEANAIMKQFREQSLSMEENNMNQTSIPMPNNTSVEDEDEDINVSFVPQTMDVPTDFGEYDDEFQHLNKISTSISDKTLPKKNEKHEEPVKEEMALNENYNPSLSLDNVLLDIKQDGNETKLRTDTTNGRAGSVSHVFAMRETALQVDGNGILHPNATSVPLAMPMQEIKSPSHATFEQPVMIINTSQPQMQPQFIHPLFPSEVQSLHSVDISMAANTNASLQTSLLANAGNVEENISASLMRSNVLFRFFIWYILPLHTKQTFVRVLFHGANIVWAGAVSSVMLLLLTATVICLPLCLSGLLFLYAMILCALKFARMDAVFCYYFFGDQIFPRFSAFVPTSHNTTVVGRLREYMSDPHMLEIMLYLTFIKLPLAFILSGVALVLFSGVLSILLSPLIYWLNPQYFNNGEFCLFGSKSFDSSTGEYSCTGWAVESFGETLLAFFMFLPVLPLTLHFCVYTANVLVKVSFNFLRSGGSYESKRVMNH